MSSRTFLGSVPRCTDLTHTSISTRDLLWSFSENEESALTHHISFEISSLNLLLLVSIQSASFFDRGVVASYTYNQEWVSPSATDGTFHKTRVIAGKNAPQVGKRARVVPDRHSQHTRGRSNAVSVRRAVSERHHDPGQDYRRISTSPRNWLVWQTGIC